LDVRERDGMQLFQKRPPKDKAYEELLEEIKRVKTQMDNSYENFQYAMDPDLIDCYIFESNAAWKKYRFLLRQAKLGPR
jgi:hypothetical protein